MSFVFRSAERWEAGSFHRSEFSRSARHRQKHGGSGHSGRELSWDLDLFGLGFNDLRAVKPDLIMVSISGYGQSGPWRNRPAFAPTVQAEAGFTEIIGRHYGDALTRTENDAYNHADVYTGLQGVMATLATLNTEIGQAKDNVDVAMVTAMLSIVNDRVSHELSDIDVEGEPLALSAPESPVIELPDGQKITIAASPVSTFVFRGYCAMMRRNDLLIDPRFITGSVSQIRLGRVAPRNRGMGSHIQDY